MSDDMKEFADRIAHKSDTDKPSNHKVPSPSPCEVDNDDDDDDYAEEVAEEMRNEAKDNDSSTLERRWSNSDSHYFPCHNTHDTLPGGLYKPRRNPQVGTFLEKQIVDTDELMVLPDTASESILQEIDHFWQIKDEFSKRGFIHKRGILMWGDPGCHAKDTPILMYDGSMKMVQDVQVGDRLMGPDSTPRNVLELKRGRDRMYRVTPNRGEPFEVNENHVLALMPSGDGFRIKTPFNMKVKDFLKHNETFRKRAKLYKASSLTFEDHGQSLDVPPYILGAWLGDGTSKCADLTTMDSEIETVWCDWLESVGCDVNVSGRPGTGKAQTYSGVTTLERRGMARGDRSNPANKLLNDIDVLNNKHIPQKYLTASVEDRLQLLAGLLDTDGYYTKSCAFDFISKSYQLANDTVFLARSLGFHATITTAEKGCTYLGKHRTGTFWRVYISGEIHTIPTKLARKMHQEGYDRRTNPLVTGFDLGYIGEDDYYGFTVNEDHLYVMGDFTVTHNSGKTATIQIMIRKVIENGGIAIFASHPGMTVEALQMVRRIEPNRKLVVVLEDFETLIREYGDAEYLAMLDGESQVGDVVFVATTNYPENLDKRFVDRPSRFDTVTKVGMPSEDARRKYLQNKEPSLEGDELEDWVEKTAGFGISHLKEIIISCKCYGKPLDEVIDRMDQLRQRALNSDDAIENRRGTKLGFVV